MRRIIGVVDGDNYELQLFQKQPQWRYTKGIPTVVVDDSGLIVCLSPEAKSFGIKRLQNISEAQTLCRYLYVITKKLKFNKPATQELTKTSFKIRSSILSFLKEFFEKNCLSNIPFPNVQKNGSDEYFIDLTQITRFLLDKEIDFDDEEMGDNFFLEGHRALHIGNEVDNHLQHYHKYNKYPELEEVQMVNGGRILQQLKKKIEKDTDIVCSGGVGSNKLIAKLACKLHKPNAVTCLTRGGFKRVSSYIKFREITGFGGSIGDQLENMFGLCTIKQLQNIIKNNIRGVNNLRVGCMANVVCYSPVLNKLFTKSVNCGKRNLRIKTKSDFMTEINYLCQNLVDRLYEEWEFNKRQTKCVKIRYSFGRKWKTYSATFDVDLRRLNPFSSEWKKPSETNCLLNALSDAAIEENKRFNLHLKFGISAISLNASNFVNYGKII